MCPSLSPAADITSAYWSTISCSKSGPACAPVSTVDRGGCVVDAFAGDVPAVGQPAQDVDRLAGLQPDVRVGHQAGNDGRPAALGGVVVRSEVCPEGYVVAGDDDDLTQVEAWSTAKPSNVRPRWAGQAMVASKRSSEADATRK